MLGGWHYRLSVRRFIIDLFTIDLNRTSVEEISTATFSWDTLGGSGGARPSSASLATMKREESEDEDDEEDEEDYYLGTGQVGPSLPVQVLVPLESTVGFSVRT